MPSPTSAAWIIETSLPPSPMAQVRLRVCWRIKDATSAFWVGEQRQATTQGRRTAVAMKSLRWWESMTARDSPSMRRQAFGALRRNVSVSGASVGSVTVDALVLPYHGSRSFFDLLLATVWMYCPRATSFELIATQRAVSTLSPVSIQILTPAFRKSSRDGFTSF